MTLKKHHNWKPYMTSDWILDKENNIAVKGIIEAVKKSEYC
jgi:hypothetical protein